MEHLPVIQLSKFVHREQEVIGLRFEIDPVLQNLVRSIPGALWSQTHRSWYVPNRAGLRGELRRLFSGKAWLDTSKLTEADTKQKILFKEKVRSNDKVILPGLSAEKDRKLIEFKKWMKSRRYSERTIDTYSDALRVFLRFFNEKAVEQIENNDLIEFNNAYLLAQNLSASYQNQVVNAVKLFFMTIEGKKLQPELIHRPKSTKLLPNVLSKVEIKSILTAPVNIKHRAMLCIIYSCGLRRGELLNLKITDIDQDRGLIVIRQAKGRKDRIAPLSAKIVLLLKEYYLAYKPNYWVFEGQDKKSRYDERSLAAVLKQAIDKCGITKPVTLHWLRHSYATHLLENGTDLRYIQEILGHSRSTTTEIYTHVSNKSIQKVVSPFDSL